MAETRWVTARLGKGNLYGSRAWRATAGAVILALAFAVSLTRHTTEGRVIGGPALSVLNQPIVTVSGAPLSLQAVRHRRLALFFFCGCQRCARAASDLGCFLRNSRRTAVWGLSEMNAADIRSFACTARIAFPLASDPDARLERAYHVAHCPTVILVNPDGSVSSRWSGEGPAGQGETARSRLFHVLEARDDR